MNWPDGSLHSRATRYTAHFGSIVNDDLEKYLFGALDDQGKRAVRAFALGNHADVHESFQDFFEHMAAQKLRTPNGLDWIRSCYGALGQIDLMVEMQALRMMHRTMWVEGVREIVSAHVSDVKFILTDHLVTVYGQWSLTPPNRRCPDRHAGCRNRPPRPWSLDRHARSSGRSGRLDCRPLSR